MEHTPHDMRTLIEKSARGDRESSKALYELLVDKVYAFVRSRTGSDEHATDITQDIFIDFFTTLSRFTYRSDAQLYAYVFLITRRKLATYYKDAKRRGAQTQQVFDEESMSQGHDTISSEHSRDIAHALLSLEETTREIVILHHFSRYTFGEIALLLHKTESAVRVRHHRALAQLAAYLDM